MWRVLNFNSKHQLRFRIFFKRPSPPNPLRSLRNISGPSTTLPLPQKKVLQHSQGGVIAHSEKLYNLVSNSNWKTRIAIVSLMGHTVTGYRFLYAAVKTNFYFERRLGVLIPQGSVENRMRHPSHFRARVCVCIFHYLRPVPREWRFMTRWVSRHCT